MARRRKGDPVHGWVTVDKPAGTTSTRAVSVVRRVFNAQKAGHAGTLDPLATGVLPIALGEATKTVPYLVDASKTYRFEIEWGRSTTTEDAEGETRETSDVRPAPDAIEAELPAFIGEVEQTPPAFSAIKVDGARAYDLARSGAAVKLAPRLVRIDALRLLDGGAPARSNFEMRCGKGTYVRSVARDLAARLGACGHVSLLRRTRVGPFAEEDAIALDSLSYIGDKRWLTVAISPLSTALDDIPALAVSGEDAGRLTRGQAIVLTPELAEQTRGGVVSAVLALCDGRPVAICKQDGRSLAPSRVFNL
ncbi:MAG: tRNA pseudouridine(55) synthase TruB [Pseudomonadota bacterium]